MACTEIQIIKTTPDVKVLNSKQEVKQTRYEASMIKDSTLHTLLTGSKAEVNTAWSNLFGEEGLLSGFRSVRDKTRTLRTYIKKNPFGKRIGDLAEGEARPIAIAINHLIAVQKSEEDLVLKYKLKADERAQITDSGNDMTDIAGGKHQYNTSYSNIARTIGRDILKSRGYRLVPRSAKGVQIAIEQEIKEGEKALEMLAKRGLLSINEDGAIINRQFRKSDGSPDMYSEHTKKDTATKLVTGIKTVTLNSLFPTVELDANNKPVDNGFYKSITEFTEDIETSLSKLKAVSKLVLPSNSSIPSRKAQEINEAIQDIETTDSTREVITQAQKSSLKVQGFFAEALTELKGMIEDDSSYQTTNDYLMGIAKYVSGSKASKHVFGTLDTKNLYETYTTDMVGLNQQFGKSISKVLPIVRLFDDFDTLIDSNLHYTYQTAVQNRLHVFEQTLNYQTDAAFARPILGSPEVQTLGKKEIDYMLGYLSDETGLTLDEILGNSNTPTGRKLNDYIESFNDSSANKLGLILGIGKDMDIGNEPIKGAKSAWDVANYVTAINDIRQGYSKGEVNTHFLVKPDATASGALITVLQASGRTPAAAEVVKDLVLGERVYDSKTTEVAEEFSDMYQLSTKVLEKELAKFSDKKANSLDALGGANSKIIGLMNKIMDPSIGIIKGPRNLMKLPFTKFIYGQAKYNNILEISKELTSEMIDNDKVPLMLDILEIDSKKDLPEGDELRIQLIAKLSTKKGVADKLVSIVEESTGAKLFNDQSKALEDIHNLLEEARFSENTLYDQIRIVPPLATMDTENINTPEGYKEAREDFGATIEKWNEAVVETGDKTLTTIKKHFPNMNSIKVLLQHMTDAAILVKALEAVYARPEFKDYKDGLMLNHDSVGSTVSFALAMEEEYKNQILEVNKKYDFVEAALRELKYARSMTQDKTLQAKMDAHISRTEAELTQIIADKQSAIGNEVIKTSFGVKPKILSEVNTYESSVKPTTKVEEKVEPLDTNSKAYQEQTMERVKTAISKIDDTNLAKLAYAALDKNKNVNIIIDPEYNGTKAKYDLGSNTIYFGSKHTSEQIAHELVHAATAQSIETDSKFAEQIAQLYIYAYKQKGKLNPTLTKVIDKLDGMGDKERLHEFMTLGLTNPEFVAELKKVPVGTRIWNKFKAAFMQMLGLPVSDFDTVYGNLLGSLYDAKYSDKTENPKVELGFVDVLNNDYKPYSPSDKKAEGVDKVTQPIADAFVSVDAKMAKLIQNTLDLSVDLTMNKLNGKDYHEKMMKKSKIYRDTYNGIARQWDENTLISKLKIYMNLDDNFDYKAMNKIITASLHAEERKASLEQKEINELQKDITKLYTKDDIKGLHALLSETPLFNLEPTMLTDILTGKITIADAIADIESNPKLTAGQLRNATVIAKDLAGLYVNKITPKHGYKTDLRLPTSISDTVSKLSALYAMDSVENINDLMTKINSSDKHKAMFERLYGISVANKSLDNEVDATISYELDKHTGNLNHMIFEKNNETKVVTLDNINRAMSNGLGWKILRKPTKTTAGIIYRDAGDISFQSGAGVNLKMDPNINLALPSQFEPLANNAVTNTDAQARIILSNEELDTLGYVRNPVYSLIKAHTHRMMLLETQSIREEIVDKFTYSDTVKASTIVKDIKTGEHLWYIKLPKDVSLADMPKEVQMRYTEAHAKSDAGAFGDSVTLVRKDMKDFVEGYKEIQIGETGTTLNKAFSILKKSILLQKIHWVITAPTKIARDAISNVSYLMSRNVPVNVIYSKTKRVMNEMSELTTIREDLLQAEFQNRVKSTPALVSKIAKLENDIKNHPLAAAHFNGFIQSLAIELSSKNEHTLSGLHNDVSSLINYLFKDDKGALNIAGKSIMGMSKFGVNGEDLLIAVANKLGSKTKAASPQAMAEALKEMGEHIKDIKERDDISAYLQEYLGTPGTSMVAVGSAAVQAVDVVAKVVDYENNMDIKVKNFVKEKKRKPSTNELKEMSDNAAQEALENFIDYKVNIPREFRFLEQTGVTSFISFTSRIQRIMFRSLRNNPVNAMFTILLNDMLNLDGGSTIFDANIFERNIFHTPNLGIDVIFPTKVFG